MCSHVIAWGFAWHRGRLDIADWGDSSTLEQHKQDALYYATEADTEISEKTIICRVRRRLRHVLPPAPPRQKTPAEERAEPTWDSAVNDDVSQPVTCWGGGYRAGRPSGACRSSSRSLSGAQS